MTTRYQNTASAPPATAPPGPAPASWASARLAGALYLVVIVLGVPIELVLRTWLVVPGDPAATAANLLGTEWLYRLGIAANLVYLVAEVAMTVLLYLLLRPLHPTLSMIAAALRLGVVWASVVNLLNAVAGLVILRESGYLDAAGPGRAELAQLFLDLSIYGYALALVLFGANCLIMAYLLARSSRSPRALGPVMGVAGVAYLTSSFLFLLLPGYHGSFTPLLMLPAVVAEGWFCLVLLRRGGGPREWAAPAHAGTATRSGQQTWQQDC